MALVDWSESPSDPRKVTIVIRESISLASANAGGESRGSVDIPIGVKVEAILVDITTAISGGSVDALEFGLSNDAALFFPGGSTRTLTAGGRYFALFEYGDRSLFDGHNQDPGIRFIGEGDGVHHSGHQGSVDRVRSGSAGTSVPENHSRITLYTKQADGTAAQTTGGAVLVTLYGTRYIF